MDIKIATLNVNCLGTPVSRAGLLDFLRRSKADILGIQECNLETEELEMLVGAEYRAVTNVKVGERNSRGTAFIWRRFLGVVDVQVVEEERLMCLVVGELVVINLYAASGRQGRRERQVFFGETVERLVRNYSRNLPVILGDFNCILENKDAANNPQQKKCESLRQLINLYKYVDIYREVYPNNIVYTFIRNNSASRLDRIYVPGEIVSNCRVVELIPAPFSDHSGMTLVLNVGGVRTVRDGERRRKSYWKLNNKILESEDFLPNFKDVYQRCILQISSYPDICEWWENCVKPLVTSFLKQFSVEQARERKQTKEGLYVLLRESLERGMEGFEDSMVFKDRINTILVEEAEGVKVRSRFKENMEKEKGSLFHLAREKKKAQENNVEKLLIGGVEERDADLCEQEILGFFEPLLNGRQGRVQPFQMDENLVETFIPARLGRLDEIDRENLDLLFSMEELEMVICNLPNNKSPGLDGLSNELYKKIFPVIKNEYLSIQNVMVERGEILSSMRRGVTRLAPKVRGVPRVEQLRPITMLNTDYTIKSRLLTRRVVDNMESLIKSSQLCSRKKRNILSGFHNIISTIEYVNQKQLSAALLSFDMDKAFDRAYIPYICRVLRKMNFSQQFIQQILDMHTGITTRFIMNKLTAEIRLTFSIRQGDPIAMLLYIFYMEPFLLRLEEITLGVKITDFSQQDEDYADDVEAMVEKEEDFIKIDILFQKFEACSGAVLSRTNKSKVLGLGGWKERRNWPLPWLQTVFELKIFGFQVLQTYQETLNRNWSTLVESIGNVILSFQLRALDTLHQRVDCLKIYILSKLVYKAQALPLPGVYAAQFERIIFRFLWRGKLEKLSLQEIYNSPDEGGLGMVDIRTKSESLFIKQFCRILDEEGGRGRKHVKYWIGMYLGGYIPDLRPGPHSERVPPYYQHFRKLLEYAIIEELVNPEELEKVKVKELYKGMTETLPPPKVVYKYNLPWDDVWRRINHPVLDVERKELMFLLVNNVLPTRERLLRMGMRQDALCEEGDGVEDREHLFCTCRRVQVAWAWMKRKIINIYPLNGALSDLELLNLVIAGGIELELVWFITNYIFYVWNQRERKNNTEINLEKFQIHLRQELKRNRRSQNRVSPNFHI